MQLFQSTPPVKAATIKLTVDDVDCYISIHAAREGGDRDETLKDYFRQISIHAAREGGDATTAAKLLPKRYFNPRRP